MLIAFLLKKVVVVSPDVGVYTAVVIAGTKSENESQYFLACHLYDKVPSALAETTFVNGGGVSF